MSLEGSKVLLVTSRRWHSCARLAMALRESGFTMDVICPRGHSVLATSAVNRAWVYRAFNPMRSLAEAISGSTPSLIVPCDDAAMSDLHKLARATEDSQIRQLIEASIGSESSYAITSSRAAIHALAEELGVAVPRASRVDSAMECDAAMAAVGLPAFLKSDGSSGGTGVCLIETIEQAQSAYWKLASGPSLLRAVKRAAVDRDLSTMSAALRRERPRLSLQQAIAGREANSTIFCWRGVVLASITVEVVVTSTKYGPSTVVRRIDHTQIDRATSAIAKRLGISGVCGFDFVLEAATGRAMLIEMNARPTQTSHLALGEGRDLAAAAFGALSGLRPAARPAVTLKKLIVLFPGELQRDPRSEYLEVGYHDVPVSEPELVRLCMKRPGLLKQLLTVQGWKRVTERIRGLGGERRGSVSAAENK